MARYTFRLGWATSQYNDGSGWSPFRNEKYGAFRSKDEVAAFVLWVDPRMHELVREYNRIAMVGRYEPIIAQLRETLGEGWHVGMEETGGGFTVIACRPDVDRFGMDHVEHAPYVWVDDQFGDRPQAGFYDGSDNDGGYLLELPGYERGALFGDNTNTDTFAIESLLGSMRVLIEDFNSVWKNDPVVKAADHAEPQKPVVKVVAKVVETSYYDGVFDPLTKRVDIDSHSQILDETEVVAVVKYDSEDEPVEYTDHGWDGEFLT